MAAEPEMVRGEGGFDSVLMRALGSAVASKGGAEGCQCVAVLGRGIGLAVKVEDGSARPLAPLTLALLRTLEVLPDPLPEGLAELAQLQVLNTRDEPVGEVRILL